MSWHERSYANERPAGCAGAGHGAVSVTGTLIAVNAFVALLTLSGSQPGRWLEWLGVMQAEAVLHGQIWRLLTATYLHASLQHVFFNMLGLYFLGPPLEQVSGRRQFILVYTIGGIAGNVLLTLAGLFGFISPLVVGLGASGSILALLGAAAVLFPDARVCVYFLLPLRIHTAAILYGVWYILNVLQRGANYGGDLCHIAGLIVGITWAYSGGLALTDRRGARPHVSALARTLQGQIGRRARHN
jgi:rhomboid protease GluP